MNAFDPTGFYLAIQTLGWTLLHFLWQGAVLGLVFFLSMGASSQAAPKVRYRLGLGMFFFMALCPVLTFIYLFEPAVTTASVQPMADLVVAATATGSAPPWLAWEQMLEPYLPWGVAFWLAGVMLMSARVSWDWWQVRRLARIQITPMPPRWEQRIRRLSEALRVTRPVQVVCSGVVRVPAVVGWLKPVILLPAAALAGLDRRQLELIIAHELAHIRRADYLVNLFQVMVETLLFYHPVVRWVSNRLRVERELCCDDEVIVACGDALTYAKALAELETQRQLGFQTALAASGGSLSRRIHRLLERPLPRRGVMVWGMSLMLALAAGSMAIAAQIALRPAPPASPPAAAAPAAPAPDEAPALPVQAAPAPAETVPAMSPTAVMSQAPAPVPAEAVRAESAPVTESNAPAPASAPVAALPAPVAAVTQAPKPAPVLPQPKPPAPQPEAHSERGSSPQTPAPGSASLSLARAMPAESLAGRPPRPVFNGGEAIKLVAPEYPRRARLGGLEGLVVAEFTIDTDGRVRAINIVQSRPAGVFNHAVDQALAGWQFEPLLKDGKAVSRRVSKAFEFTLDGVTSGADGECDPVTGTRICLGWIASASLQTEPIEN